MMKRMRSRGGVYEGGVFLISGWQIERQKKITIIKYDEGLRWPPFDILYATTNQKHAGVAEGGWNRPRDHARRLGKRDGKLRATKTTTTITARTATSPTTTTNTPLASTVSAIGPKMQQSTDSRRQ
jgi:hypothetical protein